MFKLLVDYVRGFHSHPVAEPPKRLNERLMEYWQELRGYRAFPSESEIDPEVVSDLWPACFLVQATGRAPEQGFKYTYLGTSLIEAYGDDLTQADVRDRLVDPGSKTLMKAFEQVVISRKPVVEEGEFRNRRGITVKYRCCMLPLGHNADRVDYILGGMRWRFY